RTVHPAAVDRFQLLHQLGNARDLGFVPLPLGAEAVLPLRVADLHLRDGFPAAALELFLHLADPVGVLGTHRFYLCLVLAAHDPDLLGRPLLLGLGLGVGDVGLAVVVDDALDFGFLLC